LEDHGNLGAKPFDLPPVRGLKLPLAIAARTHRLAAERDLAMSRTFEKVQASQESALSRATGAEDRNNIVATRLERNALEHLQLAEGFVDISCLKLRTVAHACLKIYS